MKCQVLIDWLTFSVKEADPNKVIQTYLGMDPALFQDTGFTQFMGYSKVMRFSDILVCSEGREDEKFHDMGVCVSMSGNGCRTFETMSRATDTFCMRCVGGRAMTPHPAGEREPLTPKAGSL